MKFLSKIFMGIAFFLHDDDADRVKRVIALVMIAFLLPFALPNIVTMFSALGKTVYGFVYAVRNNEPPSTLTKAPTRPSETFNSYPASGTVGENAHRVAKVKPHHYTTVIPLPADAKVSP